MKPEYFNASQLTVLCGLEPKEVRVIQQILQAGHVERGKGGYELGGAVKAIVWHYKAASQKVKEGKADASRRKEDAAAGREEIALVREAGEIYERTKVKECLKDWGTKFGKRMKGIPEPYVTQVMLAARECLEQVADELEKGE